MKFGSVDGSKDRFLSLNGSSSVLEALEKAKTSSQNKRPPEVSKSPPSLSTALNQSVKDITKALNGFDIDLLDPKIREKLKNMRFESVEDIFLWRDAWVKVSGDTCGGNTATNLLVEEIQS